MKQSIDHSGVWKSVIRKNDSNHSKGVRILRWIQNENKKYKIIITNLILAEFANFIQNKAPPKSREIVNLLINNDKVKIIFDEDKLFEKTIDLYNKYQQFGYVDANTALFCTILKCDYLISFDSDFDAFKGVTRIDGPPKF